MSCLPITPISTREDGQRQPHTHPVCQQISYLPFMKLEVCANSFQSGLNAQLAGAQRIELCQALSLGGLTPSYGLIKSVLSQIDIEVFVLIRPRSGDFCFSAVDFEVMKENVKMAKQLGCHGIVSGVLLENGHIDGERTSILVDIADPLPFTFHRAFDCVPDPVEALEELIHHGVDRILTSGQATTAIEGLPVLKKLQHIANNRIIILPGGGIRPANAGQFKAANFQEVHASASVSISQPLHSGMFDDHLTVSDVGMIQSILQEIR